MEAILNHEEAQRIWSWQMEGNSLVASSDLGEVSLRIVERGQHRVVVEVAGQRRVLHYALDRGRLYLQGAGWWTHFDLVEPESDDELSAGDLAPVVRAPMPGKVLEVLVAVGDEVRAGQPVVRVEAMKMEVDLAAPFDGVVTAVEARVGEIVEPELDLVTFETRAAE